MPGSTAGSNQWRTNGGSGSSSCRGNERHGWKASGARCRRETADANRSIAAGGVSRSRSAQQSTSPRRASMAIIAA
jgi:hypothetical protein